MKVSFDGIGEMTATLPAAESAERGCVVKLDGDGRVCACGDGDSFIGMAVNIRQGFAGVRLGGLVQVKCSGTVPDCGWAMLAADGAGGVKTAPAGREYLVLEADTAAQTIAIRL